MQQKLKFKNNTSVEQTRKKKITETKRQTDKLF